MSDTITDRILNAMKDKAIRPVDLARATGVSKQTVNDWTTGRTKDIKPENLVALADALDLEIRWLATGRGPKRPPAPLPSDVQDVAAALAQMAPETRAAFVTIVRSQAA